MKYMLMFVSEESEEGNFSPEEIGKMYQMIGAWWGEHSAAGRIVGGEQLKPTSTATTLRRKGDRITVTDGPFVESKEALGGFAIVDVPDLDAAIELAKSWPVLRTIEVRPLVEQRDESERPTETA